MNSTTPDSEKKLTAFELLMLALSVYVLAALFADTVFKLSGETSAVLQTIDTLICFIFLGDFTFRFYKAESRWKFMRWGWIDLLSSIPMVDIFRWGRVYRIVRVLRILRGVRSARHILRILFANRAKGTFGAVAVISLVLVMFASIAILNVETDPEANIKSAGDALWWAVSTITTVGYGDKYPLSAEGRIIAAVLMTAGVGLFGTFTAFVATFFLGTDEKEEGESDLAKELKLMRERMEQLERRISETQVRLPAQFGQAHVRDGVANTLSADEQTKS